MSKRKAGKQKKRKAYIKGNLSYKRIGKKASFGFWNVDLLEIWRETKKMTDQNKKEIKIRKG